MNKKGEKVPRWARLLIPIILIVVWLVAGGFGGSYFGKISEVAELDLAAFLPDSAESTEVSEALKKFQDKESKSALLVFAGKDDASISEQGIASIETAANDISSIEGVVSTSPLQVSDNKKAALFVANIDATGEYADEEVVASIRDTVNSVDESLHTYLSGQVGYSEDLGGAFAGIDGILLITALAVVLVILVVVYRSPVLPFFVLLTSIFALCVSIVAVYMLASSGVVTINGQVQGILFILAIGAATDYSLLYVARYREELYATKSRWKATQEALKASFEPILASGSTVIAGLMMLLLSDLGSNQALGPVGAIGIIFAMASAMTFLPAMLYGLGRYAFWPFVPRANSKDREKHQQALERGFWHKMGEFVKRSPRKIWITTTVLMLVAAVGVFQLKANGQPMSEFVLGYSEAREGQEVVSEHFPDGAGSPLYVLVDESETERVVNQLESNDLVESVSSLATGEAGVRPLGDYEARVRTEIRQEVEKEVKAQREKIEKEAQKIAQTAGPQAAQAMIAQATQGAPSIDVLVERAYPFADAETKVVDGKSVLLATLTVAPDGTDAEMAVRQIRDSIEGVKVGGVPAVSVDMNAAAAHDRNIIIPAVLGVITIILMILLRSVLAPVLLLLTTVLSFGTALGVAALLFNNVWQFSGADPSVVLYAFVFLVALGIDYNIFLMTRVREESLKKGTKKGVIKGLVVTGGVITSAGIVLAATFAALVVIPIVFLTQLAFIVAFGVLLDTFIVRSLLVPALVHDIGKSVWWPNKKVK